jgi:hypothetical protein
MGFIKSETNALCQGQVTAIIDGIGLSPHIYFPSITAAFSSTTCFFSPSKSPTNFCTTGTNIYIGNATITSQLQIKMLYRFF